MDVYNRLKEDIKNKKVIVIFAHCKIFYDGRSRTILEWGDRIIIIKADHTLLIHQPQGHNPVNYMKGAYITIDKDGDMSDNIIVNAYAGNEKLLIEIKDIYSYSSQKIIDNKSLTMVGDEKEMHEYIYNHPEIISKEFRPLSREANTKYGFIDILGVEGDSFVVVECKRYRAGINAAEQLHRYVERVKKEKKNRVKGVLVAPSITDSAYSYLKEKGYRYVKMRPPRMMDRELKFHKDLTEFL